MHCDFQTAISNLLDTTSPAFNISGTIEHPCNIRIIQKEYAESYEWLVTVFQDWAFTFYSSFLYNQDYDKLDENDRNIYRQGMASFGGVAPGPNAEFCSAQCRNQYNVYKSREKNKDTDN